MSKPDLLNERRFHYSMQNNQTVMLGVTSIATQQLSHSVYPPLLDCNTSTYIICTAIIVNIRIALNTDI